MMDTYPVLFFMNGLGALALASRADFAGVEISPRLRMQLGMFGAVFFVLGLFMLPTVLW